MPKDADRLLEEALHVAPAERAELAEELLASLDEAGAWAVEIAKRAAKARASSAGEQNWRNALADVRREVLKAVKPWR